MSVERLARCIVPVIAAAAPLLAIAGSWLIGPNAQPSSAAAASAATLTTSPATPRPSGDQLEAAAYAADLSSQPLTGCPFEVATAGHARPALPQPPTKPTVTAGELKLTAIVSGREVLAVLNGKLHRVGDQVGTGWTIDSIDPNAGTVTLRHAELGTQQFSVHPKSTGASPAAR